MDSATGATGFPLYSRKKFCFVSTAEEHMTAPHRRFRGAHFASFWRCFDEGNEPLRVTTWWIKGGSRLSNAIPGDLLWLFPDGLKCMNKLDEDEWPADVVENLGYLAEVFTVRGILPKKVGEDELFVQGTPKGCIRLIPPILIDDIVRPAGREVDRPIGSLRQGAWRLQDEMADQLCVRLRREAASVYELLFGRE
jgi:hypothetical protein